ncbi:peptidylprolyl isomerase [Pelomonas sp. SE-A7]|uniref:peptidylprolyl isomerase n=1 Tax=Pelomonas sp. SE-A7 TaxID=3054953 RepID=UPI00259C9357|nr:peptidylprolyl isomerase [Pelomonas sp. SE-A7]MDM4767301.1 peptidylprolyl isomerase [Pelomonas sp. SE-A7]
MSGCGGTGSCTCGGGNNSAKTATQEQDVYKSDNIAPVARVNGVPLHGAGESPDPESLRQRAYSELLRQAAQQGGLLSLNDVASLDGVQSEAASAAIERLLERELRVPDPDAAACRRYYEAHRSRYSVGERVNARHILFAVMPGVDIDALRRRAEGLLIGLRCADEASFAEAASESSNCPSGGQGGELGWLERGDCAPEFAAALFAQDEGSAHVGVLPRLITTRFGFHIIRVEAREAGQQQAYEAVEGAIAQTLRQQAYVTALRQYLNLLAGAAALQGVELEGAESPLLQ